MKTPTTSAAMAHLSSFKTRSAVGDGSSVGAPGTLVRSGRSITHHLEKTRRTVVFPTVSAAKQAMNIGRI